MQRVKENLFLFATGVRPPEGAAYGVIDKDRSGRPYAGHNIAHRADRESGNAIAFYDIGDETHGLVAPGSVGQKNSQIGSTYCQMLHQRRGQLFLHFPI